MTKEEIRERRFVIKNSFDKLVRENAKADTIWGYLHSQGVVIKVGQQLADIGIEYYNENVAKMLKAGYVAVEPLIEGT